jgi:hypothetical protein
MSSKYLCVESSVISFIFVYTYLNFSCSIMHISALSIVYVSCYKGSLAVSHIKNFLALVHWHILWRDNTR